MLRFKTQSLELTINQMNVSKQDVGENIQESKATSSLPTKFWTDPISLYFTAIESEGDEIKTNLSPGYLSAFEMLKGVCECDTQKRCRYHKDHGINLGYDRFGSIRQEQPTDPNMCRMDSHLAYKVQQVALTLGLLTNVCPLSLDEDNAVVYVTGSPRMLNELIRMLWSLTMKPECEGIKNNAYARGQRAYRNRSLIKCRSRLWLKLGRSLWDHVNTGDCTTCKKWVPCFQINMQENIGRREITLFLGQYKCVLVIVTAVTFDGIMQCIDNDGKFYKCRNIFDGLCRANRANPAYPVVSERFLPDYFQGFAPEFVRLNRYIESTVARLCGVTVARLCGVTFPMIGGTVMRNASQRQICAKISQVDGLENYLGVLLDEIASFACPDIKVKPQCDLCDSSHAKQIAIITSCCGAYYCVECFVARLCSRDYEEYIKSVCSDEEYANLIEYEIFCEICEISRQYGY